MMMSAKTVDDGCGHEKQQIGNNYFNLLKCIFDNIILKLHDVSVSDI